VQERNARNKAALPLPLLRPIPRHVRLSANGIAFLVAAIGMAVLGLWWANEIYNRARQSERHVALFDAEAVRTDAEVVRLQPRGENGRRLTVHYTYSVDNHTYAGSITTRRGREPLGESSVVGSRIPIRYLASEPHQSWVEGHVPIHDPLWPAFIVAFASLAAAVWMMFVIRRQSHLLTNGRPAPAFVTKVEKKRGDKGTYWRVHYEWTVLSGAKRKGTYKSGKKRRR
jgi:hypothetical protein